MQWICDRCGIKLSQGAGYGVTLEVQYHHAKVLELCPNCENEFTLWLGHHPLWETTIEQMTKGLHIGQGYPSQERVQEYLEAKD